MASIWTCDNEDDYIDACRTEIHQKVEREAARYGYDDRFDWDAYEHQLLRECGLLKEGEDEEEEDEDEEGYREDEEE